MPFIPHTADDIREMLECIGVNDIQSLFDEIPVELLNTSLSGIPTAMTEMQVTRLMQERAALDAVALNFVGAGAYEHHIPAAVWQITSRGEFYSAYTPYQAEASQGTLQLVYEYQSMMSALTGLAVSNASLYDGASALAEAILMAIRAQRNPKARRILMPRSVHPSYRDVVYGIVGLQGIGVTEIDYHAKTGQLDVQALDAKLHDDLAALVISQPNFFGSLEEVDALTDWAHHHKLMVIALVNPTSLALLKPPGLWGEKGADIVVGDGQPLGAPLTSGGPYFGFICSRSEYARQMPGRIVGRTVDAEGKAGFVLTLQAREQHIRRSKATSNICTNQGLMVTAATIYMALLGAQGLHRVASACHANTQQLKQRLEQMGLVSVFSASFFHETVVRLPVPIKPVLEKMAQQGIVAGYNLGQSYPELQDCLLVCATETRTDADLDAYMHALTASLKV